MKLGLVQTKHNPMYNFLSPVFAYTAAECHAMQAEQLAQNMHLLAGAAGQGYDLLVTTECINYIRTANHNRAADAAYYPTLDAPCVAALGAAAKNANSWLVAGLGCRVGGRAYNAALVFDRQGALHTIYHKMHLAGDEGVIFTPGDAFCTVDADFGRFGVCICWDMQFPETARTLALAGATLIVCPTWGWEADLYGRARAYENGIFAAAAMAVPAWGSIATPRTPSSVAAPNGALLCCAPANQAALAPCQIDLRQAAVPRTARLNGRRPELYRPLTAPPEDSAWGNCPKG